LTVADIMRRLLWPLVLLPVVWYGAVVCLSATNVPILDDYDTILGFLNQWDGSFQMLCQQHNEHRLVFSRIVVLAVRALLGHIDLRILIFVGSMALFLLFVVLSCTIREQRNDVVALLVPAYILFSFQNWENMAWATASLQNYGSVLFVVLALHAMAGTSRWAFGCGLGFGVLASFTSGNGMLVFASALAWQLAMACS
jgi:hypothetical protein